MEYALAFFGMAWKVTGALALALYLPLCVEVINDPEEYTKRMQLLAFGSFALFVYFALWG